MRLPTPRFRAAFLFAVFSGLIPLNAGIHAASAQTAIALLPSSPVPAAATASSASRGGSGVMLAPRYPVTEPRAWWHSSMALSLYALAGSETFDMYETQRILSHPQWLCGYNPQSTGSTIFSQGPPPQSISAVCGPSPGTGQLPNYAYQGGYQEVGWTTQLHLASPRNFGAVLAWNVGLDATQVVVPFLLRRHRPFRNRLLPELTNFAHAAAHLYGGFNNLNLLNGPTSSPNTYFSGQSQLNAEFPGPRWWGAQ